MKTHIVLWTTALVLFAMTGCSADAPAHSPADRTAGEPSSISTPTPASVPTQVDAATSDMPEASSVKATVSSEQSNKVSETDRIVFLEAINAARAQTQDCGSEGIFEPAPPLSWNDRLANAAYEHSYDMANSDTFSHEGSGTETDETAQTLDKEEGSTFRERIEHNGYRFWKWIGENIAAGYSDPDTVVAAWIASPHHCSNLMNPDFTEVGMARVDKAGSHYRSYWSQEFGAQ
jgi:uncharacterized protein YkwD